MDPARLATLLMLAGGAWYAWRRGLVQLPGLAPPPSSHSDPSAADALIFVPWPLPGGGPEPMAPPIAPVARDDRAPRGIRNHNPGNIRRTGDRWKGLSQVQADPAFFQFDAPVWGLRALARLVLNYKRRYGLTSVSAIIGRWAPPNENNTPAYAAAVASALRVSPDAPIDIERPDVLREFVAAIVRHENGQQPYPGELIDQAVALSRA